MLSYIYGGFFILFFLCSLLIAHLLQKHIRIVGHVAIAFGCAAGVYMLLYIPVQMFGKKSVVTQSVPLRALSQTGKNSVYVLALAVSGDADTKKDMYIFNLNKEGALTLGMFAEGEVKLSFEEREDGVLERRTSQLIGRACWFTIDEPHHEYTIRVPMGSMERPARVKEYW